MRSPFLAIVLAVGAAQLEAQTPLLPLGDGHRWSYDVEHTTLAAIVRVVDHGSMTATCQGGREVLDGQEYHTIRWVDEEGELESTCWVQDSAGEVLVGGVSDDDVFLLPTRAPGGGRSTQRMRMAGGVRVLEGWRRGELEQVQVPAGTFQALPVEAELKAPAVRVRTRVWYAPGVGAVRIVETVESIATRVTRELTLRSYEVSAPPVPPPTGLPGLPTPSGFPLVRAIVASGGSVTQWQDLMTMEGALLARVRQIAGVSLPGDPFPRAQSGPVITQAPAGVPAFSRFVGKGITLQGGLQQVVLVSAGDVTVGGPVQDCVLMVDGKVTISGELRGSLVLAAGKVVVTGSLRESVLLARSKVAIMEGVTGSALQAESVAVQESCAGCTLINTPRAPQGEGIKQVQVTEAPLDLVQP